MVPAQFVFISRTNSIGFVWFRGQTDLTLSQFVVRRTENSILKVPVPSDHESLMRQTTASWSLP
jgi:hypothetical protein